MPSIVVIRGAGDKAGEDVVEPLLSSVEAQKERGRAELDKSSSLQQTVNLGIVHRTGLNSGQLVEVHDALQGQSYRGKITGLSYRISGSEIATEVDIQRPLEV